MIGNSTHEGANKVDNQATQGLTGIYNSLSYRVEELEKHFHNREKWFGVAATPSGETHVADRIAGGIQPFQLTAGDDDFGSWVQILGSNDTPVTSGYVYMDVNHFLVTGSNSTTPYVIQLAVGESSGLATLVSNEAFSEAMYVASTNLFDEGIQTIPTPRVLTGSKVWARTLCIGGNATTLDFYFALHEYAG